MTVYASKHYDRKENDLYETEPWVTHALLRHFPPVCGRKIWEPAAGNHKVADALLSEGANVFTSDIATYDREHTFTYDFLSMLPPFGLRREYDIITNPPYGWQNTDAAKFARNALQRTDGWVALLLTAKFDSGKTRRDLLADNPRFAFKITLLDRIRWFNDVPGVDDHAWFVWGPLFQPAPRLFWEGK
jgi:hypothetical protein